MSAKLPLFTLPGFCVASAIFFGIWWLLSSRLRFWSLRQDETGEALCTRKMRFHSGWGILAFAATVTVAPILWMNSLQYQWSSTIYGLYFFASCGWMALATAYLITVILQRQRVLTDVLHDNQFYFLGVLFFAFTLLQAYFEFAQYFVIWNGNVPDETFWYLIREQRLVVVGEHDFDFRPFLRAVASTFLPFIRSVMMMPDDPLTNRTSPLRKILHLQSFHL